MGEMPGEVDVAIVGGGPAGLAAAAELRSLGVGSVLVLERDSEAGGVPRFCGHSPYGFREFRRLLIGGAYARALVQRAEQSGANIRTGATVTALEPGPRLTVSTNDGVFHVAARAVLLATGARESSRADRLIGGTKPGGIMVTGALQELVYGSGMRPFRRPVVLGSELVSFSALLTCRHAGISPLMMVEPGARSVARHPSGLLPRMLGIPFRRSTDIVSVEGREKVEAVVLSSGGATETIETDGVIVTGGFRPESGLAWTSGIAIDAHARGPVVDECGRCSEPGYYAAGNLLRPVETAGWCWQEGRDVARAIARDLKARHAPDGVPVTVSGDVLKYAVPQRIAGGEAVLDRLQLRVDRPVHGRLSLRVNGHEIAGRTLRALPERRLWLPLPPPGKPAEVVFEEAG